MANSSSSSAGTSKAGPSRPRLLAVRLGRPGHTDRGSSRDLSRVWLFLSTVGVVTGGVLWTTGHRDAAHLAWATTTAIELVPLAKTVVLGLIHRRPGVDVIALLAMVGALALGQYLAGAVIALMLSSGKALESYANRRATRELSGLLARAPRTVTRYEDGSFGASDRVGRTRAITSS